jgi:hypothetical protein
MGRFELRELSRYSESLPQDLPSCMDAVGAHRGCRESKSEPELILKFRPAARFGEVSDFTLSWPGETGAPSPLFTRSMS